MPTRKLTPKQALARKEAELEAHTRACPFCLAAIQCVDAPGCDTARLLAREAFALARRR